MKRLFVLRHAKSDWTDAGLPDHDRPLAPRGRRAAAAMGRYMRRHGAVPELILCSTARRAVETCALAVAEWAGEPPTEYDRLLYLTGRQGVTGRLAQVDSSYDRVLVIAHNPDLQQLVLTLGGDSDPEIVGRIGQKFPTAAFAAIELPIGRWPEVSAVAGRIVDYATPRSFV